MKHIKAASLVPLLIMAIGCGGGSSGDGSTTLEVPWSIGGGTCNQSGVKAMVVTLIQEDEVVLSLDAICTDGSVVFEDLAPGRYDIKVEGFRDGGKTAVFLGSRADVDVPDGEATVAGKIELSEATGALDLLWQFSDGKICAFAGVNWIDVTVWDEHSVRITDDGIACNPTLNNEPNSAKPYLDDAAGFVIDDLFAGQYRVFLLGYNKKDDGMPVYWAEASPKVSHSSLTGVSLVLRECTTAEDDPCL